VRQQYPERYQALWDVLKKVKTDPEFLQEAQKFGFELMDDISAEELIAMTEGLFPVFAKYEHVYKEKQ
jgi:hypothetical protein